MVDPPEATVEEILASIKRIIVEDGPPPASAQPADGGAADDADDVLELTRPIAAPRASISHSPPAASAGTAALPISHAPLVSPGAADASRQALAYLSSLKLRGAEPADGTLEALVREMLRPMLKTWLDAELPAIVERLVVQEIARLTARPD